MSDTWLTREAVADELAVSVRTLARYRREGLISGAVGPFGNDGRGHAINDPQLEMNAVRYHRDEVDRFKGAGVPTAKVEIS
jgi:predicted site-specific integrase-resolvase